MPDDDVVYDVLLNFLEFYEVCFFIATVFCLFFIVISLKILVQLNISPFIFLLEIKKFLGSAFQSIYFSYFSVLLIKLFFFVVQTLLAFVNFKLYHSINVKYPPILDPRLEASAAGLLPLLLFRGLLGWLGSFRTSCSFYWYQMFMVTYCPPDFFLIVIDVNIASCESCRTLCIVKVL